MSQQELLTKVVGLLDSLGIDYLATGSVVSCLQGEPRASHDIDLVVALSAEKVNALIAAFPSPPFYLSADAIHDALREKSMFNLLNFDSGDKVDFWLLTDSGFDRSRFARKQIEPEWQWLRQQANSPAPWLAVSSASSTC